MGLFKPDWKSKNEQKALQTVEHADLQTLFKIAFETPHREVCLAAIRRMDDEYKADVVMGADFLCKQRDVGYAVKNSWYAAHTGELQSEVISLIEDHAELGSIARTHPEQSVRELAMHRLIDDPKYTNFILREGSTELKLLTISLISDELTLIYIVLNNRDNKIRLEALSYIKNDVWLVDYASRKETPFWAADIALKTITDLEKLEPFLDCKDSRGNTASRRLLAEGTPEQRIMVLRDHSRTLRDPDVLAAAPRFERAVVEFILREFSTSVKNKVAYDSSNPHNYLYYLCKTVLSETNILRECRDDALCREVIELLSGTKKQPEIRIAAGLWANLAPRVEQAELEALLHNSNDWPVKKVAATELRQRGQLSDQMLFELIGKATQALRSGGYAADEFLAAFPCRECVDALVEQLRNWYDTNSCSERRLPYSKQCVVQAANVIKKFYLNAGNDELRNYLRRQNLHKYHFEHFDEGDRSCGSHTDIDTVEFPVF